MKSRVDKLSFQSLHIWLHKVHIVEERWDVVAQVLPLSPMVMFGNKHIADIVVIEECIINEMHIVAPVSATAIIEGIIIAPVVDAQ